ncbi:hypothetical protein Rhopal_002976-T1 [Rhodotorula paludigena]|uniref:Uncharacterized protein n=1 Tax=Rhodotorula paludigena TaxID=86838 RepID=A0AAV5GKJ4_9BASI|nr:hypothetical protein Rhopal_002976-T1 [Rhodotorula paludigena]
MGFGKATVQQMIDEAVKTAKREAIADATAAVQQTLEEYKKAADLIEHAYEVHDSLEELSNVPSTPSGKKVIIFRDVHLSHLLADRQKAEQQAAELARLEAQLKELQERLAAVEAEQEEVEEAQIERRLRRVEQSVSEQGDAGSGAAGRGSSSTTGGSGAGKRKAANDAGADGGGAKKSRTTRPGVNQVRSALRSRLRTLMGLEPNDPLPPKPPVSLSDPAYPRRDPTAAEAAAYAERVRADPALPPLLGEPYLRLDWTAPTNNPDVVKATNDAAAYVFERLRELGVKGNWDLAAVRAEASEAYKTLRKAFREDQDPAQQGRKKVAQALARRAARGKARAEGRVKAWPVDWVDDDLVAAQALEGVSEEETDAEETKKAKGARWSRRFPPAWRSRALEEKIKKVDDGVETSNKLCFVQSEATGVAQTDKPLPPLVRRWMVSASFAEQHPELVADVSLNAGGGQWDVEEWGKELEGPDGRFRVYARDETGAFQPV